MSGPRVDLGDRRAYLGASDAAVIMGVHPHKTPLALWMEKRAPEPIPEEINEDILRGHHSEPVMRVLLAHQGVQERAGVADELQLGTEPIIVHPDFLSTDDAIHELKAPRQFGEGWGEEGTDEVPMQHLIQLHAQIAVARTHGIAGAAEHEVNALCGHFRRYRVAYSSALGQRVLDEMRRWWDRYVLGGERPAPITSGDLASLAVVGKTAMVLPDGLEQLLTLRQALGAFIGGATKLRDEMTNRLAFQLGNGRPDLPQLLTRANGTVLASVGKMHRDGAIDTEALVAAHPELAALVESFRKPPSEWVQFYARKPLKEAAAGPTAGQFIVDNMKKMLTTDA
jgi:hypothetical protein